MIFVLKFSNSEIAGPPRVATKYHVGARRDQLFIERSRSRVLFQALSSDHQKDEIPCGVRQVIIALWWSPAVKAELPEHRGRYRAARRLWLERCVRRVVIHEDDLDVKGLPAPRALL